jgi:Polysaccharide pyruvyl transferase
MKLFKKRIRIKPADAGRFHSDIKRESIIIHHYCPHTYNIGDHFVIQSIRKHLKKELPQAVFVPKACAGNRGWGRPTKLQGENINLSNEYADAVIIGGSDQYNNWALRIKKEEIVKLAPPLYLIGLGISSSSLEAEASIKKQEYLEDILVTNQCAKLSSVRDNFTNEFLKSIGYKDATVTGCPAMYFFNEPFQLNDNGYVALTFPFPVIKNSNSRLYNDLIKKVCFLLDLVKSFGLQPIISCHDDRDVFVAQKTFPEEQIFFSNYVDDFIEFYKSAKFIIGSRLHASIFVSGLGKPFVNLNIDKRGLGFSETFGLQDWNINIDDPELENKIKNRMQRIIENDLNELDIFYTTKNTYYKIFLDFIKQVADDINKQLG